MNPEKNIDLSGEDKDKRLKWYEGRYGPYIEKKGWQNKGNLFRKPTMNEWIILLLLIMCVYFAIVGQLNENTCAKAVEYYNSQHAINGEPELNLSNISLAYSPSSNVTFVNKEMTNGTS